MASNTSSTHATAIAPRVLADRVLGAIRPVPILAQMANLYSLAGKKSGVLGLNRLGDSGPGTAATEGTDFTTETVTSYGTEVDLTPVEAAARLMKITDQVLEKRSGYLNAAELFQSNDVAAIVAALQPEAMDILAALDEKLERDLAALFASLSADVGDLTAQCSLSVIEQALYELDLAELPRGMDARRAFVFAPVTTSQIRKEMEITSGGVAGVMWGKANGLRSSGAVDGYVGDLFGVPVHQLSPSVVPTSGTVPGTGGYVNALIVKGSGNPEEEEGGSGEVGSLVVCEGRAPTFSSDFALRGRAVDLLGVHRYAVALRGADIGVKILANDVIA